MMRFRRSLALLLAGVLALGLLPMWDVQAQGAVAEPFRAYYDQRQGLRILGHPLTDLLDVNGIPAQYFEKGRIEDHRGRVDNPDWALMFGRLTAELIERDPQGAVSETTITYGTRAPTLTAPAPACRRPPISPAPAPSRPARASSYPSTLSFAQRLATSSHSISGPTSTGANCFLVAGYTTSACR